METLVIAGAVIVLAIAAAVVLGWDRRGRERRVKRHMRDMYGAVPKKQERHYDYISIYWNEVKDHIPEDEKIDDITWNDLEMDKIYERISNGNSFVGEQILFARLHQLPKERGHLGGLEKKVQWLDENEEQRIKVQYSLWNLGKHDVNYYVPMFFSNLAEQKISNVWIYRLLQCSMITLIIAGIIFRGPLAAAAGISFLANVTLYTFMKIKYEVYLESIAVIVGVIRFCSGLAKDDSFPQELIPDKVERAVKLLAPVTRRALLLQQKKQAVENGDVLGMIQDYLIGSTLWDFIQYDKIIRGLECYKKEFMSVYNFAGEIDTAIAVGSFRRSVPGYCLPEFAEGKKLKMENIYHPLIADPVKNSLYMERNLILTGSNASGKSTFIKAAAINIILASGVHTCLADQMQIPEARVITSMSMRDDVVGGESYFITEIKYLKRIVEESDKGRLAICMIDEILRGTNTRERIAASEAVLRYLNRKNCLVMVATHDLELTKRFSTDCDMYYFSERLGDEDVSFDYMIKDGVSDSSNAIDLLEFVEFPAEVVREARGLVKKG